MPIAKVLADSPSFSRQEVGDDERDGININGLAGKQTVDDYKDTLDNSTDILKITYLSDSRNWIQTFGWVVILTKILVQKEPKE